MTDRHLLALMAATLYRHGTGAWDRQTPAQVASIALSLLNAVDALPSPIQPDSGTEASSTTPTSKCSVCLHPSGHHSECPTLSPEQRLNHQNAETYLRCAGLSPTEALGLRTAEAATQRLLSPCTKIFPSR